MGDEGIFGFETWVVRKLSFSTESASLDMSDTDLDADSDRSTTFSCCELDRRDGVMSDGGGGGAAATRLVYFNMSDGDSDSQGGLEGWGGAVPDSVGAWFVAAPVSFDISRGDEDGLSEELGSNTFHGSNEQYQGVSDRVGTWFATQSLQSFNISGAFLDELSHWEPSASDRVGAWLAAVLARFNLAAGDGGTSIEEGILEMAEDVVGMWWAGRSEISDVPSDVSVSLGLDPSLESDDGPQIVEEPAEEDSLASALVESKPELARAQAQDEVEEEGPRERRSGSSWMPGDGGADARAVEDVKQWLHSSRLVLYFDSLIEHGYDTLEALWTAEADEVNNLIASCGMPWVHARRFQIELQQLRVAGQQGLRSPRTLASLAAGAA